MYDGTGGQDRANRNLLRFVEAHFVTKSPWGEGDKVKTLAGREVWWEEKDGERVIMPDGVVVDRVASRVENGELVSLILYFEIFCFLGGLWFWNMDWFCC